MNNTRALASFSPPSTWQHARFLNSLAALYGANRCLCSMEFGKKALGIPKTLKFASPHLLCRWVMLPQKESQRRQMLGPIAALIRRSPRFPCQKILPPIFAARTFHGGQVTAATAIIPAQGLPAAVISDCRRHPDGASTVRRFFARFTPSGKHS